MPLPGTKKGSSVGRVRMAYSFPQSTLVNYYVGGAGVGAVSTANRRALRRRAEWRPTDDGKGSKKCIGHCQPNRYADKKEFVMQNEGTGLAVYPTPSTPTHRVLVSAHIKNTTGSPLSGTPIMSALGTPIAPTELPPSQTILTNDAFTPVASYNSQPDTIVMFIQLTQAVEITSFQMGSGTLFTLEDETNVVTEGVVNIAAFGGATVSGASAPYSATVSLTMSAVGHGVMIALTLPAVGDHYLTFFGKI